MYVYNMLVPYMHSCEQMTSNRSATSVIFEAYTMSRSVALMIGSRCQILQSMVASATRAVTKECWIMFPLHDAFFVVADSQQT